mgnify:CR=1 FL=1
MIITRENIKEEASNLNDEILNLEKKYGVNILGKCIAGRLCGLPCCKKGE